MNFKSEISLAKKAVMEAGDYLKGLTEIEILLDKGKDIKLKQDKISEEIILNHLSKTKYPIISEETNGEINLENQEVWIIDPLDGSLNFSRGIPNCCVSIALWRGESPLMGMIYDFNHNDFYYGTKELGSFLNDKKIFTSKISSTNKAIICSGFPSDTDYSNKGLNVFVKKVQRFKKVRLLGSAALSLAYISSGKIDAYHEKSIYLWDVAAGLGLVKFSGGDYRIQRTDNYKYNVFASNGKIFEEGGIK